MILFYIMLAFLPTIYAQSPYRAGNCSEAFVICDSLAECKETRSNYTFQCICGEGFMGDGFKSGTGCFFDKEPCTKNEDCHRDGFCDLAGDKSCVCKPYYHGNGKDLCLDIDECKSSPCAAEGGLCRNQIGAEPVCGCDVGYEGDGFTCTKSPYRAGNCSEAFVICDSLAECVETRSNYTFQCICGEGSMGDGFKSGTGCFYDIEPCNKNEDCHVDGFCNLAGDSTCVCKPYYHGNGKDLCLDIDECKSSPCAAEGGLCQNQIGADPKCGCDVGYEGDGFTCTKICLFDDDCIATASCVNKDCKCNSGYEGNGFISCTASVEMNGANSGASSIHNLGGITAWLIERITDLYKLLDSSLAQCLEATGSGIAASWIMKSTSI